jgi:hypothetical protein
MIIWFVDKVDVDTVFGASNAMIRLSLPHASPASPHPAQISPLSFHVRTDAKPFESPQLRRRAGTHARSWPSTPLAMVYLAVGFTVPEQLVLFRSFILPVEDDKLAEDEKVKEDGETGSGEPREVGEDVVRFGGYNQDGDDVGEVYCQSLSPRARTTKRKRYGKRC